MPENCDQLALALGCYFTLLKIDNSDYIYAARKLLRIVLAFLENIDIHCLPGDELDRVYELQTHCIFVEGLLALPSVNVQTAVAECSEAIAQLCYLLELLSIPLATVVETLCLMEDKWATMTSFATSIC